MFSCQIKVRICSSVLSSIESPKKHKTFHRKLHFNSREETKPERKIPTAAQNGKVIEKKCLVLFSFSPSYLVLCIQYNLLIFHRLLKFYFLIMHVCFLPDRFFSFSNKKFNQKIIFQARFDGKSLERLRGFSGESKQGKNSQA